MFGSAVIPTILRNPVCQKVLWDEHLSIDMGAPIMMGIPCMMSDKGFLFLSHTVILATNTSQKLFSGVLHEFAWSFPIDNDIIYGLQMPQWWKAPRVWASMASLDPKSRRSILRHIALLQWVRLWNESSEQPLTVNVWGCWNHTTSKLRFWRGFCSVSRFKTPRPRGLALVTWTTNQEWSFGTPFCSVLVFCYLILGPSFPSPSSVFLPYTHTHLQALSHHTLTHPGASDK